MEDNEDQTADVIPVFIPALAALLIHAEDQKGSPLTVEEAMSVRDNAQCVMMTNDQALKMDKTRGYSDINPENCWFEWQMLRRDLGREPELDTDADTDPVNSNDEVWRQATSDAQASLAEFCERLADPMLSHDVSTMIKTRLDNGKSTVLLWLFNVRMSGSAFLADVFELPAGFGGFEIGDTLRVENNDVIDWAIIDQGTLFGGYSLRVKRSLLDQTEQLEYDEYIGVKHYA